MTKYIIIKEDEETYNKLMAKLSLVRRCRHLAALVEDESSKKKYVDDATRYDSQAKALYDQLEPEVLEKAVCRPLLCDNYKKGD